MVTQIHTYLKTRLELLLGEKGASAVEYALIVSFIALLIIVAVTAVGTQLSTVFTNIKTKLGG